VVEGVVGSTPMTGTLTVKLRPMGFDLAVEFTDSQGENCSINASTSAVLKAAARNESVKGSLKRSARQIGEIDLKVDWSLVKKTLPSLA